LKIPLIQRLLEKEAKQIFVLVSVKT
jgi:hypothetical protein